MSVATCLRDVCSVWLALCNPGTAALSFIRGRLCGPTDSREILENGEISFSCRCSNSAGATDHFYTVGAGGSFPGEIKRPGLEPVLRLLEWSYTSVLFVCIFCTQGLLHFYYHHNHRRHRHSYYFCYFHFCCFQVDLKKLRSRKQKMPWD